ncbi:hypothetical protein B0H14DRAFT_2578177 [Mycena olivaceomarginata]|nr:hypothetical protein B0H14DRAFT_2578177 [Mycena olivaceomarginata]
MVLCASLNTGNALENTDFALGFSQYDSRGLKSLPKDKGGSANFLDHQPPSSIGLVTAKKFCPNHASLSQDSFWPEQVSAPLRCGDFRLRCHRHDRCSTEANKATIMANPDHCPLFSKKDRDAWATAHRSVTLSDGGTTGTTEAHGHPSLGLLVDTLLPDKTSSPSVQRARLAEIQSEIQRHKSCIEALELEERELDSNLKPIIYPVLTLTHKTSRAVTHHLGQNISQAESDSRHVANAIYHAEV